MKTRIILTTHLLVVFFLQLDVNGQIPIINGMIDDYWDTIVSHPLQSVLENRSIASEADFSGNFKLSWNDTALFVLIEVADDSLFIRDTMPDGSTVFDYQKDNVEIYLDFLNSKASEYGKEHVMWRLLPGLNDSISGRMGQDTLSSADLKYASSVIENTGYIYELAIPIDSFPGMTAFSTDSIMGFEIKISDNDGEGPESVDQLASNLTTNKKYPNPYMFNTIRLKPGGEVVLLDSIVADGIIDGGWKDAPLFNIEIPVDLYRDKPFTVDDKADCSGYFRVRWDTLNIYILGVVRDDNFALFHESGHQRDNFGIHFDYKNAKTDFYEEGIIADWKCGYANPHDTHMWNPEVIMGYRMVEDWGYISEHALPRDKNPIDSLYAGKFFGIDVIINDADFDGEVLTRDQIGWEDEYDLAWQNPYRYGAIELLEGGNVKGYNDAPDAPTLHGIVEDTSNVKLMWEQNDKAIEYLIFKDGKKTDTVDKSQTNIIYHDLDPGFYSFTMVSIGEGKLRSEFSNPYDIEILEPDDPDDPNIYVEDNTATSNKIVYYPVPAHDHLFVQGKNISSIHVIDLTGKKKYCAYSFMDEGKIIVDISNLNKGIYLFTVISGDQIKNVKFIKH